MLRSSSPSSSSSSVQVQFCLKWSIPILVSLIMFCNHYVRDCPGALEKPLEVELSFSPQEYSILNALYFFPNIISPLLAGIFIQPLGGIVICVYYSLLIASSGHVCFAIGASLKNKGIMYLGKALSGSMYEIIDAVMPIVYLGPMFKEDFQIVVGVAQICLRMGSVVNFIVSPYTYSHYGLAVALWIASLIGCSSIVLFGMSRYVECNLLLLPATDATTENGEKKWKEEEERNEESKFTEDDLELVIISEEGTYNILQREEQRQQSRIYSPTSRWSKSSSLSTSRENVETANNKRELAVVIDALDEKHGRGNTPHKHLDGLVSKGYKVTPTKRHEAKEYIAISLNDESQHSNSIDNETSGSSSPSSSSHAVMIPKSTTSMTWSEYFFELTQLHQFSLQYYLYLLAGAFLYGAIVPFWFYGSKYLQDTLYCSIETGDSIMTLPEGLVVITGFPFGLMISKFRLSVRTKLSGLAFALGWMALSYVLLLYGALENVQLNEQQHHYDSMNNAPHSNMTYATPKAIVVTAVVMLGTAFSLACALFWGIINLLVEEKYLPQASGILSCAVNILPAVLPPILTVVSGTIGNRDSIIVILGLMAVCGSISGSIASSLSVCSCVPMTDASSAESLAESRVRRDEQEE